MVHYSKLIDGIVRYIDEDMISKMGGSWKAWGIGAIVLLAANRGPAIFDKLKANSIVQALGIIEGEMVDVDALHDALLTQARKGNATVELPVIGSITYSASDVESLYRCIRG